VPRAPSDVERGSCELVENASVPGGIKRLRDVEEDNGLVAMFFKCRGNDVLQAVQVSVCRVLRAEASLLLRKLSGDERAKTIEDATFKEPDEHGCERDWTKVGR